MRYKSVKFVTFNKLCAIDFQIFYHTETNVRSRISCFIPYHTYISGVYFKHLSNEQHGMHSSAYFMKQGALDFASSLIGSAHFIVQSFEFKPISQIYFVPKMALQRMRIFYTSLQILHGFTMLNQIVQENLKEDSGVFIFSRNILMIK